MTTSATERYSLVLAPSGLVLVQELLNTIGVAGRPDLLADVVAAQGWLDVAVARWAGISGRVPKVTLSRRDLPRLRTLRTRLQQTVRGDGTTAGGDTTAGASGALDLAMTADGSVTVAPRGTGARWVCSAVLGECFLAQQNRSWSRLKLCRRTVCSTAFFDRSRNNSGVWHDVHRCGNVTNLQASRARRRSTIAS